MPWFQTLENYNKSLRYLTEMSTPVSKPKWTTPNKVKLYLKNVILREFSAGKDGEAVLIIPPQAGHHSSIADYDTGQSLVEAAVQNGIKSVYVAEWKSATPDRKDETIDDFIVSMRECIESIGSKVTLIGLCQGGWQSAMYTALYPEDVSNLILAGAPIDFHAGNGKISMYAALYPMSFYKSMVAMGNGILDGRFLLTGFKMLNPTERFYSDYMNLFLNMNDEAFLTRYRKFRGWYEYTLNLPGAFYLQVVQDLFKENHLIQGRTKILGQYVDLKKIEQPLTLVAGDRDDITPEPQLFNMEQYVSSKNVTKLTVPAGHIGVFMAKKVVQTYWPKIFESIKRPPVSRSPVNKRRWTRSRGVTTKGLANS